MMTSDRVVKTVTEFLIDHADTTETPLVLAVSGGVDSMVLLHITYMFANANKRPLHVVHVNHGLRASASRDEHMVIETCREWGIPVHVRHIEINSLALEDQRSVEADARTLRYDALVEVAKSLGAASVLLAHHADDQLETVLWRLTRGTSVSGLSGMRPTSRRLGIDWLRPLLGVPKEAITEYARENEVHFCEDETNTDLRYTRNFLRKEVVPKLKMLQPAVLKNITELTERMHEEDEYLEDEARAIVRRFSKRVGNDYLLRVANFRSTPRPLQRRAIKIILYCLASGDFSHEHIESCVRLAHAVHPSGQVHLPMGLRAWRSYDQMYIGPSGQSSDTKYSYRWDLYDGAVFDLSNDDSPLGWTFHCRSWNPSEGVRADSLYEFRIPAVSAVEVQSAQTSERIELLGSRGSKKVQDVFTDCKIPRNVRRNWPLFYVEGQPVWLPGLMRGRRALLENHTSEGWVITTSSSPT